MAAENKDQNEGVLLIKANHLVDEKIGDEDVKDSDFSFLGKGESAKVVIGLRD